MFLKDDNLRVKKFYLPLGRLYCANTIVSTIYNNPKGKKFQFFFNFQANFLLHLQLLFQYYRRYRAFLGRLFAVFLSGLWNWIYNDNRLIIFHLEYFGTG